MESMCLDVSLVTYIETIFVAQIIKSGVIWIVARADCIKIKQFHEDDVFDH